MKHGYTFMSPNLNNKAVYGNIQHHHPLLKPNFVSELIKLCASCFSLFIFFNHVVPTHTKVNAEYYACIIQINLIKAIGKKQPDLLQSGLILHQDNAPAHKAKLVQEILQKLNIETLTHPPYSPDLASCDFCLFPVLKDSLWGTRYENREELTQAMTGSLRVMSRDWIAHVFRAWESRMNKCIENKGGYFEKQ